MLKHLCSALLASAALVLSGSAGQAADNVLTEQEKKEGYILLFDGKSMKGWHINDPFAGWRVTGNDLCLGRNGRLLCTDKEYDNFVLKCEFKVGKDCNSGVFIRVSDQKAVGQNSIEVQILDDSKRKGPTIHSTGSFYSLVAPSKHVTKPAGQWNSFIITANKNLLTVEQNGEKITEMDLDKWDKPLRRPDGTEHHYKIALKDLPRKGLIGLQDYAGTICYRNIKLKPLK